MSWNFPTKVFTFATLIYFGALFKPGIGQHTNGSLRDFERELLNIWCPKVDICNPNASSASLRSNNIIGFDGQIGIVSCCTGCSCHPDCDKQKNCCFPDEESLSPDDAESNLFDCLSTHMVPPGKVRRGDVPAYKTIVEPPPGGCVTSKPVELGTNQVLSPTCDNIYFPVFGSFYPVYSADTDLIYKNVLCALCHGASEFTEFVPRLTCEFEPNQTTIYAELDYFESGTLSPRCIVDFRFSNSILISKHRCYKQMVNTCESKELKNDGYGYSGKQPLSIDIVRSLCENGLYSPSPINTKVYRNAFCILCASAIQRPNDCGTERRYNDIDRDHNEYIIDTERLKTHLIIPSDEQQHPEVCLSSKTAKVEGSCRRLFCSPGKVRNDNGDCEFITTKWVSNYKTMTVFLTEIENEDRFLNTPQMDDANSILQVFKEGKPWSKKWYIYKIYRRNAELGCGEGAYEVVLGTGINIMEQLFTEIQTLIKAEWPIKINGSVKVYRQSLESLPENTNVCKPDHSTYNEIYKWREINENQIGKLFFCEQVLLAPREYRIESGVLYSNLTRRDLLESEYVKLEANRVRVCVEDTSFLSHTQSSGGWHIGSQIFNGIFSLFIGMLFR